MIGRSNVRVGQALRGAAETLHESDGTCWFRDSRKRQLAWARMVAPAAAKAVLPSVWSKCQWVLIGHRGACASAAALRTTSGPVVLMSTFLVPSDQVDNFLEGFKKQFAIMRKQPGFDLGPASSRHRREWPIHELYRLGVGGSLQARV
jgi:hypothetical protein